MGRVTPIVNQKDEDKIILSLQKGLRTSYPSAWAVGDTRVGSFLNLFIRAANGVKRSINTAAGYNSTLATMVANGASKSLSQNFLNEVLRQASAGTIPFWMTDPISGARAAAAQNELRVQEDRVRREIEQKRKEAEGPSWLERLFGKDGLGGVASSWGTAAKVLPWVVILGGAAFLWFSFGQPARTAGRNLARRL